MTTIFVVCGKVNYTNLSRYSHLSERTYRRYFQQGLGFEELNQALIEQMREPPVIKLPWSIATSSKKVAVIPTGWIGFITANPNGQREV